MKHAYERMLMNWSWTRMNATKENLPSNHSGPLPARFTRLCIAQTKTLFRQMSKLQRAKALGCSVLPLRGKPAACSLNAQGQMRIIAESVPQRTLKLSLWDATNSQNGFLRDRRLFLVELNKNRCRSEKRECLGPCYRCPGATKKFCANAPSSKILINKTTYATNIVHGQPYGDRTNRDSSGVHSAWDIRGSHVCRGNSR